MDWVGLFSRDDRCQGGEVQSGMGWTLLMSMDMKFM